MKRLLPLLAIAALMAVLAAWLLHHDSDSVPAPARPTTARPSATPVARVAAPSRAIERPALPAERPASKRVERRAAAERAREAADAPGQDQAPEDEPELWTLDPHGIKSALREALPEIERCHQQARQQDRALPERITVGITIAGADTAAESAQVIRTEVREATSVQQALDDCLLKATSSLQFERPAHGAKDLLLPFDFSSEE